MGLESVALLMAIEEEFGVEIPDAEAEKIGTVGEMYDFLRKKLRSTPPVHCITQRMFYKVRKAIVENYNVPKQSVTLNSTLKELVPQQELKDAWPYLDLFAQLEFPRLEKDWWTIGSRWRSADEITLRDLLTAMATLNAEGLLFEPGSDEEIWVRLTKVIHQQISVEVHEIQPHASFTRDLGVD